MQQADISEVQPFKWSINMRNKQGGGGSSES